MRIYTAIKIISALVVLAIMTCTVMLYRHVTAAPQGGVFNRVLPEPGRLRDQQKSGNFVHTLETRELPDIDPGEQAFEKAYELLALGLKDDARRKLATITTSYPNSSSATAARRIIGEMNLDEILDPRVMTGKQVHTVQRGDSYLAVASRYGTTIDCMVHLNAMLEMKGIQPGDKLLVMPLDFQLVIEPRRRTVSLWQEDRFICEYPALSMRGVPDKAQRTTISLKSAEINGRRVLAHSNDYRAASKVLQLSSPALQLRGWSAKPGESPPAGILMRPHDMEELALLTRVGNPVEIR